MPAWTGFRVSGYLDSRHKKVVLTVIVIIMIIRIRRKRRDHMKNTSGKQDIKERQKITILGTAHILQKVQM